MPRSAVDGGERPGAFGADPRRGRRGRAGKKAVEPGVEPGERAQAGDEGERLPRDPGGFVAGREDRTADVFRVLRSRAGDHGQMTQIVFAHARAYYAPNRRMSMTPTRLADTSGGAGARIDNDRASSEDVAEEDEEMKLTFTCTVALTAGILLSLSPAPARCEAQAVEHTIRSGTIFT